MKFVLQLVQRSKNFSETSSFITRSKNHKISQLLETVLHRDEKSRGIPILFEKTGRGEVY